MLCVLEGDGVSYHAEPRFLAEIGALSTHLEVFPVACQKLLWRRRVGDLMVLVVGLDQIVYD